MREAVGTRTFWQLFIVFFCVAACVNGTMANLAPLLTDGGASGRSAAFATSLFGLATLAGRIANGYLVDRFFAPRVAAISFVAAAVGIAMLLGGGGATAGSAFLAATLLGFAIGAEADVMPYLVSRYFGMRSMAALFGCIFGAYTLGNGVGRYAFAAGFDSAGSYRTPLAIALAILLVASAATFVLPHYPRFRPPDE
jgi:predicted MFS family arabinose efflux permease